MYGFDKSEHYVETESSGTLAAKSVRTHFPASTLPADWGTMIGCENQVNSLSNSLRVRLVDSPDLNRLGAQAMTIPSFEKAPRC